ncbi:MAG: nucleoid-associated protein YgaU [Planctomycetota bacterium]|jgi:nucleoid-associated protein YgaU
MQSIERYGVVALLFLLVTVAAVLMWSGDEDPKGNERERTLAQTPVNPGAGNGNGIVASRTQSRRNAPLTDESARLRSQRAEALRKQQEQQQRARQEQDRYGVPSSGLVAGDSAPVTAGIVPGGSGDERESFGTETGTGRGNGSEVALLDDAASRRAAERVQEIERQEAEADAAREAVRRNNSSGRGNRSSSGVPVYVVKKNEVLGVIAQQQLGSARKIQQIVDLNPGLNPDRIREGMKLRMPASWAGGGAVASPSGSSPAASTRAQAAPAPAGTHAYVVQEGESLWRIAEAQLGSGARYTQIEAANPNLKNGAIKAGQTIYLPGASSTLAGSTRANSTPASSTRSTVATSVPSSGNRTRRGVR